MVLSTTSWCWWPPPACWCQELQNISAWWWQSLLFQDTFFCSSLETLFLRKYWAEHLLPLLCPAAGCSGRGRMLARPAHDSCSGKLSVMWLSEERTHEQGFFFSFFFFKLFQGEWGRAGQWHLNKEASMARLLGDSAGPPLHPLRPQRLLLWFGGSCFHRPKRKHFGAQRKKII